MSRPGSVDYARVTQSSDGLTYSDIKGVAPDIDDVRKAGDPSNRTFDATTNYKQQVASGVPTTNTGGASSSGGDNAGALMSQYSQYGALIGGFFGPQGAAIGGVVGAVIGLIVSIC